MSDKIKSQHLQRKAILYIRQSSAFQVQHNQESRRLDAEKIRQEFIKSTKFKLTQRPLYPRVVPASNPKPLA